VLNCERRRGSVVFAPQAQQHVKMRFNEPRRLRIAGAGPSTPVFVQPPMHGRVGMDRDDQCMIAAHRLLQAEHRANRVALSHRYLHLRAGGCQRDQGRQEPAGRFRKLGEQLALQITEAMLNRRGEAEGDHVLLFHHSRNMIHYGEQP